MHACMRISDLDQEQSQYVQLTHHYGRTSCLDLFGGCYDFHTSFPRNTYHVHQKKLKLWIHDIRHHDKLISLAPLASVPIHIYVYCLLS